MITHDLHKTKVKTIHFISKTNKIDSKTEIDIKHPIIHLIIIHLMMNIFITKIINNFIKTKDTASQNPVSTHSYQPTQMQNEIPLPYYLQQHEITKSQLTNF